MDTSSDITVFTTILAAKEYASAISKISKSYETCIEELVVAARKSALASLTPAQRYVIEKQL